LNLEEDYAGTARVMEVLSVLYNLPSDLAETERGQNQYQEVGSQVAHNSQVKALITQLEEYYDGQQTPEPEQEEPTLAPDVERFLREIGQKLDDN
jgi:hypothetical protein